MGGAEAMVELLKFDPKVKAVVSSGYSNDPIMANYQDYGFCGVIAKPFTKAEIEETLRSVDTDSKLAIKNG
jgi:DNA-binding NarL/FixJ family response regulator